MSTTKRITKSLFGNVRHIKQSSMLNTKVSLINQTMIQENSQVFAYGQKKGTKVKHYENKLYSSMKLNKNQRRIMEAMKEDRKSGVKMQAYQQMEFIRRKNALQGANNKNTSKESHEQFEALDGQWDQFHNYIANSIINHGVNSRSKENLTMRSRETMKPVHFLERNIINYRLQLPEAPERQRSRQYYDTYVKQNMPNFTRNLPYYHDIAPDVLGRILSFKNPKVLSNYVSELGQIYPRTKTGLSKRHQNKLSKEIKKMRHLALISPHSHPDATANLSELDMSKARYSPYFKGRSNEPEPNHLIHNVEPAKHNPNDIRTSYYGYADHQLRKELQDLDTVIAENILLEHLDEQAPIHELKGKTKAPKSSALREKDVNDPAI